MNKDNDFDTDCASPHRVAKNGELMSFVSIWMPTILKVRLAGRAHLLNRSLSQYIRMILSENLEIQLSKIKPGKKKLKKLKK